jgi:DNA-binding protein HU-beta
MKKRELAIAVANHVDVDPKVAARVIDGTIEVILATVAKGEDVTLTGFAKLSKVKRAARVGRNPQTGEPVRIKAKTVAKITPLKGFKDVVLGVGPAPKIAAANKSTPTVTTASRRPATSKAVAATTAPPSKKAPAKVATATTRATPTKRTTARTTPPAKKAPAAVNKT